MAKFAGSGAGLLNGTDETLITLVGGGTAARARLYDVVVGSVATPADQACHIGLKRFTAAGTEASGFTPVPLDAADAVSSADCGLAVFSVEPTYTASEELLTFSVNQRATLRWVAAPGSELVVPASAANGIGVRSISSTAAYNMEVAILFEE